MYFGNQKTNINSGIKSQKRIRALIIGCLTLLKYLSKALFWGCPVST
jgi:hypothetical protein